MASNHNLYDHCYKYVKENNGLSYRIKTTQSDTIVAYLQSPRAAHCCSLMGWKLFLLINPTSTCFWTLLLRYFSKRNIQGLFSQHISTWDKSSLSHLQHSLEFSFVLEREWYSHQRVQPLLCGVFMGIVQPCILHPSLRKIQQDRHFPLLSLVNLCVTSRETSTAWETLPSGVSVVQTGPAALA